MYRHATISHRLVSDPAVRVRRDYGNYRVTQHVLKVSLTKMLKKDTIPKKPFGVCTLTI